MACCTVFIRNVVESLTTIVPILIPVFVALIAYWQWKTNKDKLRLDLYNRRFVIYTKTLDFIEALLNYSPSSQPAEAIKNEQKAFINACRESQFLFSDKSGIYVILKEINKDSFTVIGFKEHGSEMAKVDPAEFLRQESQCNTSIRNIGSAITKMEESLAVYLNFHRINS